MQVTALQVIMVGELSVRPKIIVQNHSLLNQVICHSDFSMWRLPYYNVLARPTGKNICY